MTNKKFLSLRKDIIGIRILVNTYGAEASSNNITFFNSSCYYNLSHLWTFSNFLSLVNKNLTCKERILRFALSLSYHVSKYWGILRFSLRYNTGLFIRVDTNLFGCSCILNLCFVAALLIFSSTLGIPKSLCSDLFVTNHDVLVMARRVFDWKRCILFQYWF